MKPLHSGITFRRLTAADIPAANELRRLAGWNQSTRDWAGYLEFEPEGCLAAEENGKVVGTATTITYGKRFGWIGMVLVDPAQRRGGIGTALLNRSIDYLRSTGVEGIKLDATPMGRTVYVPLGFQDEYELARYQGVAAAWSGTESRGIAPLTERDLPEVIGFDAEIFGAERATVIRSLAARNPELCFVSRSAAGIDGYIIAREGSNAIQVGPWLARDTGVAEGLLRPVFRAVAGKTAFIDVPATNPPGQALMKQINFSVQRGYMRMFLGTNRYPGRSSHVFSTSGAEKG
jgi:GNAT superfamily N-acetyltransferase